MLSVKQVFIRVENYIGVLWVSVIAMAIYLNSFGWCMMSCYINVIFIYRMCKKHEHSKTLLI